jgi:hypothetical protein
MLAQLKIADPVKVQPVDEPLSVGALTPSFVANVDR